MKYSLNAGEWNSVFAVPTSVVDKYIKLAGAGSLKLLLYLMRHGGKSFEASTLKDALGFRKDGELEDAAGFWVQRGILKVEEGVLTATAEEAPVQQMLPEMEEIAKPEAAATGSTKKATETSAAFYTAADIADRINSDKGVAYLFSEAQKLYGRLLKQPESRTILMLVDHYGLPAEVSAMLLKYCFKIQKTSTGYIQSVAQTWSDDGIRTATEADAQLSKLEHRFAAEEKLREAMQLTTKFSPKQQNFIKTWIEEWEFSVDMIMHAYDLTLDNTGGMNFSYTNKILDNWRAANIRTREAAEQERISRKNGGKKSTAAASSSINVDAVEMEVFDRYRKQGT